jgi:Flp pilus assembly protein TadD
VITSFLSSLRKSFVVAIVGGLAVATVGCSGSTSHILTYAQEARQKGIKQFNAGDFETAAGSFRSATRQDPRDYKSYAYLGDCYQRLGSFQQAAQSQLSSLQVMDVTLEGKSDKAFRAKTIDGLAQALAKGQDRTAVISMPQPGKRPAEDSWLRAKVYRYSGDADAAVEAYTQASLQDANDKYIAKDYGLYLAELGQNRTADVQLRRAYRLMPEDKEIAAALTKIGTVPGPALKEQNELAKTHVPRGPIPELKMPKFMKGGSSSARQPAPAPAPSQASAPTGEPTVQAPRD